MSIRWPETIVHDQALTRWLQDQLFNDDGAFDAAAFANSLVLYEYQFGGSLLEVLVFGNPRPAPFSRAALNRALLLACERSDYHPEA